jgi:hypothetical protein
MSGLTELTAEEKLVISLCRMDFNNDQISAIESLCDIITDWNEFVRISNEQGVIALCWHNLNRIGTIKKIPSGYQGILHNSYLKSVARNTFLNKSLDEFSSLIKNDFGKIVLLKGMALEKTVFGNMGVRQMTDIDILVNENSAIKLRYFMLARGYESDPVISKIYEKRMFLNGKHLPEMRKNGVSIEIHFRLFREKGNSLTQELINGAQVMPGREYLFVPDLQLHFLYLIWHLEKHEQENEFQVRLYTDLIVLLSAYQEKILNEKLLTLAKQSGLGSFLLNKLLIIKSFWGYSFPDWMESQFSQIDKESAVKDFILFLRNSKSRKEQIKTYNPLKTLEYIPGIINKLLFITGYIIPSIPYMKANYHIKSTILCLMLYPVRWVQIMLWVAGLRKIVKEGA